MRRLGRARLGAAVLALALAVSACGGGGASRLDASGRASSSSTVAPTSAPTTEATAAPVASTDPPMAPPSEAPSVAPPPPPPPPAPSPVDGFSGVDGAGQVIAVIADGYGRTTATFTAYERTDAGWREVFGPWRANVGRAGVAPPGAKREGDGRTPSGAFGFDFAFGVLADPGSGLPYRPIPSSAIVWDDDPGSPRYNLWTDTRVEAAGADPEPMYNQPAYDYGAVIAYNTARTPGLGSAIFLHVSTGGPTAGCVSLPRDLLVEVLRWLDPARGPRIVVGTPETVSS